MQWMISHQDARRNLSPGELIYANSMVAEEIALENKKKKEKANEQFYGNRFTENKESVESTPIGVQSKSRSNTWTDSQTAKKAGVGIGTVARYNRVMNSDDEDIQTKEFTPILKYDILSYPIQNISVNDDVVQIEDESFHIGDVANIFVGYYGKDGRKRYLEDKDEYPDFDDLRGFIGTERITSYINKKKAKKKIATDGSKLVEIENQWNGFMELRFREYMMEILLPTVDVA